MLINHKPVFLLSFALAACGGGTAGNTGNAPGASNAPGANYALAPVTTTPAVAVPSGPCQGSPIAPPTAVLYAPAVPQTASSADLVGINIQNSEPSTAAQRIATFGQVFEQGRVVSTDTLVAVVNGTRTALQMDTLATWPDGSVKLASLAMQVPALCANTQISALLAKAAAPATTAPTVNLAGANTALSVTLSFSAGSYTGTKTVDLGAALRTALANAPDYWLRGPLVTQARVDVPIANGQSASTSTLHLTADVSVFADGTAMADVQFNNDLTTVLPQNGSVNPQGPLPALAYTATINFQGKQASHTVSQVQYSSWRSVVWSHAAPQHNIQRDIAHLQRTGAILPYDLSNGVNNTLLQSYDQNILQKPGFGQPLATNGVSTYMPGTGGRADIGFTTQYNTVWLLTQDSRAAKVAFAQSDTSGAIPWNYKLPNGKWLSPASHPRVWVDGRGGPQGSSDGIANTASSTVWSPDSAHQPSLNYVPYIMSGARWNFDRLNSQASYNLVASWPGWRCKTTKCNTLINGSDQLRAQAWSFRTLKQAAFVSRPGTTEATEWPQTVNDNWAYVKTQMPLLAAKQGEATGWMQGDYGNKGATAEWQQDFLTTVAGMAVLMGDADGRQFMAWQQPWLSGRFLGNGMNPRDGCNYNLMVLDPTTNVYYNTWSAIAAATSNAGLSNGTGWGQSQGYYCQLAVASLNMALIVNPADAALRQAVSWLEQAGAPYTDKNYLRSDPTFNVVRP